MFNSVAVAVTPSSIFISAEVAVTAAPAIVKDPDTSKLPFTSIVVAFISISVSLTRSSTPSADWWIYVPVSPKLSLSVLLIKMSSLNWK